MRILIATVAALLIQATAAWAGDPVMPLGDVRSGMQCTGYSVVRGTDIAAFDIEVIDVVDDRASGTGPRILVKASGPAVDETGIGPGFSGSPIYCPDAQGTQRSIGAISESIGEYGGKVVLATPIEAIIGNPPDAPRAKNARSTLARARPLSAPLTVTGLSTRLGAALQKEAAKRGRVVLATPAGPLGSFPVQQLRPGSAFGVGYASGDISASAIGTVAYIDGGNVWGFGHPLDGVGARALLLQDAYVFRVVNNPIAIGESAGTYKYAAAGHDIGTLTNDSLDAVVGRMGALPPTVPVRVKATDLDTGAERTVATNVADETDRRPADGRLDPHLPRAARRHAGRRHGARWIARAPDRPRVLHDRVRGGARAGALLQPLRIRRRRRVRRRQRGGGSGEHRPAAGAGAGRLLQGPRGPRDRRRRRRADRARAAAGVPAQGAAAAPRSGREEGPTRRWSCATSAGAGSGARSASGCRPTCVPASAASSSPGSTSTSPGASSSTCSTSTSSSAARAATSVPRTCAACSTQIDGIHRYDGIFARRPGGDPEDFDPGQPSYRDPDLRISGRARATIRIKRR